MFIPLLSHITLTAAKTSFSVNLSELNLPTQLLPHSKQPIYVIKPTG